MIRVLIYATDGFKYNLHIDEVCKGFVLKDDDVLGYTIFKTNKTCYRIKLGTITMLEVQPF